MSSVKFDIDTLGNLTQNDATGTITITYTAAGSITGFLPKSQQGPLIIPDILAGLTVTSIFNYAFKDCTNLTSITIPASVTSIGDWAFENCTGLTAFVIPASGSQLLTINFGAFYNCRSLGSITIPALVTSIANLAFYNCIKLESIIIPASVESIGERAFDNCTGLATVKFDSDSKLLTIGNQAFASCTNLTSIFISALVTSIGVNAFQNTTSLTGISVDSSNTHYLSVDGVLYNEGNTDLIRHPIGKSGSTFTIMASVTSISTGAFQGCNSLTSVTFASDSQLQIIGGYAFASCTGLTSIVIPDSVTSISTGAFQGCNSLTLVTFASDSQLKTIGGNAFHTCTGLLSIVIPASVTSIGNNAFQSSGLITMYVYAQNQLSLTPTTPMPLYGKTFTIEVIGNFAPTPGAPICFPAGTKVTTDQGDIAIEKLNPKVNTIRGKKIVGITKTIPLQKHIISIEKDAIAKNVPSVTTQISKEHKVFYKGNMVKARDLVEVCQGVTAIPYNGEILYNVLLKKHEKMMVNNLICETLDPENIVAKIYNGNFQTAEKSKIYEKLNHIIRTNDIPEYKKLYASLK